MKLKILVSFAIIFLLIGDIDANNSTSKVYRSLIDGYHGFYRVVVDKNESLSYENYTLNIDIGDKIIWINDDPSDTLTIISEQQLWDNDTAILKYTGRQFNYVFNNTGTYTFYIKQYRALSKQTVLVSDPTSNVTDNLIIDINETNVTDNFADNLTIDTNETNITDINGTYLNITPVTTPVMTSTIIPTTTTVNHTTTDSNISSPNVTDMVDTNISTENIISTNPVLMPLNILKNFKIVGFISFIIIMVIFLIKY